MTKQEMQQRTRSFALRVIKATQALPENRVGNVLGSQLLRSGTSVGANYRAACRAKSPADFISKLGNVEEEADESGFWMEMLSDPGKATSSQIKPLLQEANELVAIMIASINTTKKSSGKTRTPTSPIPHSALRTPN